MVSSMISRRARADSGAWPLLVSEGCVVLFYTIIGCIMLLRPEPVSQAKGLGPVLLALAGTYGTWLIPLLPYGPELPSLAAASAIMLLFGEVLMVYTLLTLGWSFSLVPQARTLITSGPYAIVRHPLYLVEEIAVAGILLQYAWFAALPFLVLHAGVQIRRIKLEEEILMASFPDYAAYAKRTSPPSSRRVVTRRPFTGMGFSLAGNKFQKHIIPKLNPIAGFRSLQIPAPHFAPSCEGPLTQNAIGPKRFT